MALGNVPTFGRMSSMTNMLKVMLGIGDGIGSLLIHSLLRFVPGDIPGLISLFGSKDYFVEQLTEFFHRSEFWPSNAFPNPYYWAGNEVCEN